MPLSPLLFALALSGASHAQTAPEDEDLKFTLDGYYRVRLHHYNGLFDPDANWPNEPGAGRYPTLGKKEEKKRALQLQLRDPSRAFQR